VSLDRLVVQKLLFLQIVPEVHFVPELLLAQQSLVDRVVLIVPLVPLGQRAHPVQPVQPQQGQAVLVLQQVPGLLRLL